MVHSGTADFKLKGMEYVAEFGRDNLVFSNEFESDMMALIKNQADANSGWVKLKVDCLEALSDKLTLNSLGATSCKGEALVAIHTDGSGELPYELECGPDKSWQRKVTAMANRIGVDKVRFDVTNNEQVTCILRTRIGGVLKPLDGASKSFQCHKPTDAGASSDLVPETRPEDPPAHPTLTGDFSYIDNGGTRCPRQSKALINFKTSKPDNVHWSLDCTIVRNGVCNCDRTHKVVKTGKNAWSCVKVVVDPPRNKDKAKVEVKTVPKKTAAPKLGKSEKAKVDKGKGKGKTAKKGNGSSAVR